MPKGQFAQNRAGVGYGRWVAPGGVRQGAADGGSFPKKAWSQPPVWHYFTFSFYGENNDYFQFGQNFFKKAAKKETDPTGKTPAMLLHEVFKEVSENYEEVASHPKAYRCILTVAGQQFAMVAPAKKTAKQKTAEMALRTLRPDLNITPFEDGVTVQPVTAEGTVPLQPLPRPVMKSEGEDAPPAKKIKV
ncbi:hypothetical protein ANCCEY_04741 [Ancylostoma ceylanicum]|uniref:DRBM domain-containing protein n=1 Tax=Ancylostoma ceylanicum TaxID=53326 RepID=A0A0D6LVQ1_9BILA|nr:hypothetical protein ANCCEY_04741 [Ancylostoma ceylanicum]